MVCHFVLALSFQMSRMRSTMNIARKIYTLLCGPKLLHFALPAVMIYLIVGTVAQKYIGLYQATRQFFSSPIFWLGDFPLPGMPVFLALIFVNLTFKLIFKSPWDKGSSGIILTHIGAMLLLLGGLFTAFFSTEGYMVLPLEVKNATVSDYHIREFVIMDEDDNIVFLRNHKDIQIGDIIRIDGVAFHVTILEACQNCDITARENKTDNHKGMAQHMQLSSAPLRQKNEENVAGMTLQITNNDTVDIHTIIEDVPRTPEAISGGKTYRFSLRRESRQLPFSVELIDFKKDTHPGTTMAKSYRSTVLIKDGNSVWESVISMNEPLRYKGYTFFQSSFIATPQGDISVLAVVWNVGRAFPYISGLTMCIGLILHLVIRRRTKKNKVKENV